MIETLEWVYNNISSKSIYNLYYSKMLKSLPVNSITSSIQPSCSAEIMHQKKSCMIRKKMNDSGKKSS